VGRKGYPESKLGSVCWKAALLLYSCLVSRLVLSEPITVRSCVNGLKAESDKAQRPQWVKCIEFGHLKKIKQLNIYGYNIYQSIKLQASLRHPESPINWRLQIQYNSKDQIQWGDLITYRSFNVFLYIKVFYLARLLPEIREREHVSVSEQLRRWTNS